MIDGFLLIFCLYLKLILLPLLPHNGADIFEAHTIWVSFRGLKRVKKIVLDISSCINLVNACKRYSNDENQALNFMTLKYI